MTDEAICRWLVGDEGRHLLARAAEFGGALVQRAAALRRELSAERAAAVLQQIELRERARAKFLEADRLYYTRIGLEQATDSAVAAYKAERYRQQHAVADLCCGIGGDLLALAKNCDVTGVDRDAGIAALAAANLEAAGRAGNVVTAEIDPGRFEASAWHIDPDRRPGGRRSVRVEHHEPGLEVIEAFLARSPHGAIKLAPGAEFPPGWRERAELEWISRGGECKQLVAWFGELARDGNGVRATVLARGLDTPPERQVLASFVGDPAQPIDVASAFGRFLFEPDAAVLAADLTGALANRHALSAVTPGIAYLTGDHAIADPAIACFEIIEIMPFRIGPLRSWLAERGIGRLEIKKRGVEESPEPLRKQLRLSGDGDATLILMPVERRVTAIVTRRMSAQSQRISDSY